MNRLKTIGFGLVSGKIDAGYVVCYAQLKRWLIRVNCVEF